MTMATEMTYTDQLNAAKALTTMPVADAELATHFEDLLALKQQLDQRVSQLDNRLHPVESKSLVNTPYFEKFGLGETPVASDDDHTNVMMGFLSRN
ncbi:hypothetical protein [Secundilactobacillus similis]|nr:hypothetical protein [Secundilactobacillus similis]